jgi:hypothetical protein
MTPSEVVLGGRKVTIQRPRRVGGGRKRATAIDTTLSRDLDVLVEPPPR